MADPTGDVEERLADWVRSGLGKDKADLAWGPPLGAAKAATISLTLLEAVTTPIPRTAEKPPLKLTLRYLLTVQAPDPKDAHRLFVRLAFAAMDETEWTLDLASPPPALWTALGIPLQPSIVLNVPLYQERPARKVGRVREPMVLRMASLRAITGTVVGPGDFPIMGAWVELPSLGRAVLTDHQGRFRLPGVPTRPAPEAIRVRAKGVETSVDLSGLASSGDEPLVIHLNQLED